MTQSKKYKLLVEVTKKNNTRSHISVGMHTIVYIWQFIWSIKAKVKNKSNQKGQFLNLSKLLHVEKIERNKPSMHDSN